VVGGGLVFAMDTAGQLSAIGEDGRAVWRTSLVPEGEQAAAAIGGGMAYAGGTLFASTGFAEVAALDAATGAIRWRRRLDAPVRAARRCSAGSSSR
jgi:outer membrane protein assembly factor BamB